MLGGEYTSESNGRGWGRRYYPPLSSNSPFLLHIQFLDPPPYGVMDCLEFSNFKTSRVFQQSYWRLNIIRERGHTWVLEFCSQWPRNSFQHILFSIERMKHRVGRGQIPIFNIFRSITDPSYIYFCENTRLIGIFT